MYSIYDTLRAWVEIDLDALQDNFLAMKRMLPEGVKCASVIKADAYGHGAVRIARLLEGQTDYFAVAMTDEAEQLRRDGIKTPILVLAHTLAGDLSRLEGYNIESSVSSLEEAEVINRYCEPRGSKIGIHIAIDTGMTRIGFPCTHEAALEILEISKMSGVEIRGVFSHYAASDSADLTYTKIQTERFKTMIEKLRNLGVNTGICHLCNSAAAAQCSEKFDMVREGILLYGLTPSSETDLSSFGAPKPVMSLRTHISGLRKVPAGTPVSYSCTFVTKRDSVIATVQAGYADGVPRLLSNEGEVLVRGQRAPIAGRICMDQMMIDVTDIKGVQPGDTVTLFGADGEEFISAEEQAAKAQSIGYEIVCGISKRVPRVYIESGRVSGVANHLI